MWTANEIKADLLTKIREKTARVGVIGLGYVGLPFAVEQAKAGFHVMGIDLSTAKVDAIRRGENYIPDVQDADLRSLVLDEKRLTVVSDFASVGDLDILILAVPTPLTKNLTPDLSYVEEATRALSKHLRRGQLVCLESTTYPGTTEDVLLPILQSSGLVVEQDFFAAHSPERVDPGNHRFKTKNTAKIVGGVGPQSHEVAMAFYSQTVEVIPVSSAKAAELAKVFENTFRAVNIALVNELTLLCDGIELNVWEILDAAFTKPFGIMPFYPGPGVGGHCIPLDPHYLEWKAKEFSLETHFISLAGEVNRKMPTFVREKAHRCLNQLGLAPSRSRILMLGVAYKKDIGDYRESPALKVIELLRRDGAQVSFYDPHVDHIEEHGWTMTGYKNLTESVLAEFDLVIITTDHSTIDYQQVAKCSKKVLDTRNATKHVKEHRDRITLL